jgi:TP901 family phage tail tape measure protein
VADDVNAVIGVQVDTDQATAQLRALQGQIQQFTRGMAKSSGTAAKAQRDFEKDLLSNINASKQWNASFRTMADSTSQFANALDKNKLSMGEYFKYGMGATRTFGKAFDKEMRTVNSLAERRVKSLQTQYIQLGKDAQGMMKTIAITPNNLDFSKYGTQMAMVGQRQQIFNDLVKKGSTELINFGKNTQWAGRQLMVGFTLPLAAFGSLAAKTFMEIEKAAIKFQKVYGDSFTTSEQTDKALKGIEDLALSYTKYGIAVKDTIDLAADLAAAGYEGLRLNEAVIQTQRLAVLGEIDQQTAMKTTISLQNAFQISSKELGNTINFLNAVENQTVVSLQDLSAAIPRVAPVIKGLGGDVQDLAVFLAAMEEGGISAEQGANALKSGLASLINPSRAASEMLGGLGINIQSIIDTNKGDLMGIVSSFGQALATLDDFQRQQVLEKLFGKYQYARLGALFNNIVKDGSQANRALQLATSSAIELAYTANKELKAVEDATSNRFVKAIEDIKAAMAPIGKIFLQIVTPVIEFGTRALEAFNGLDEGVKRVIAGIVAVVAGVGPVLLMTVGLVANGIGNFIKFVNLIRNAFLKMTGQYKGVAGGSQILTEAQLQGVAAADSLAAAEGRVTKSLLVQRDAVLGLASAYAQTLSGARGGMGFLGATQGKPRGYNSGVVSVPGSGNRDTVPAMLTPGEAVIPAEMAKKYAPLINAMVSGQIPGYELGLGVPENVRPGSEQALQRMLDKLNSNIDLIDQAFQSIGSDVQITAKRFEEAVKAIDPNAFRSGTNHTGMVFAHGAASRELSRAEIDAMAVEQSGTALGRGLGQANRATAFTNYGFYTPEAINAQQTTGTQASSYFSQFGDVAMQGMKIGLDESISSSPIFDEWAKNISIELAKVGDAIVTDPIFYQAVEDALTTTITKAAVSAENTAAIGAIQDKKETITTVGAFGGDANRGSRGNRYGVRGRRSYKTVSPTDMIDPARLQQAANSMVQELDDATSQAQRSASPAERSAELGDDWAIGYAKGIERSASQAAKASEDMVERAYGVTDNRTIKSEGMLGNDVKMVGGVPANPTQAQALIDAQYGPQQPAKKGIGNKLAGFALRKLKIDEASLAADSEKTISTKKQTQAIGDEIKERQTASEKFKTLNGRLMAGSFAVDSVAIGMSMMGGEVGEMGQKLLKMSSAVTMVSMVLPLLTSKAGLVVGALMTAAAAYYMHNAAVKESEKSIRDAAQSQSDALIGSAKAISEFQLATGAESIQQRRGQRNLSSEQATVYFQALTGEQMASTLSSYESAAADKNVADVVANDLASMAINFDMTAQDIQAYSNAVATALKTDRKSVV